MSDVENLLTDAVPLNCSVGQLSTRRGWRRAREGHTLPEVGARQASVEQRGRGQPLGGDRDARETEAGPCKGEEN